MSHLHTGGANTLLGYPADARLLIINADDFGLCHAINAAILRSLRDGIVCSTTVMVPCPWALHAMHLLKENPTLPFGIHLTVICDPAQYRWGPLTCREKVPSLLDETGYFYSFDRIPAFLARVRLEELEVEFRAQIEMVLAANLTPTHLDWHALRGGGGAAIVELMLRLAHDYGRAMRVAERPWIDTVQRQGLPTNDYDFLDSFGLDTVDKAARYARLLHDLPVGLSEWAVHPGVDDAELRAIGSLGPEVRQTDFDFLISAEARAMIQQEGITLLSYKPLQQAWRAKHLTISLAQISRQYVAGGGGMIRVEITDDQRQELEQVSRQAVGRVALRTQMVLLAGRGYSVPRIAEVHDCGQDVVRLWLHRYKEEGVRGLEDTPRPGRPRTHALAGHIVDTQASQSPACSGHVQSCWTVGLLAAYLATRFRLTLSPSSIRRYLHAMGWRWARPRLAPAHKADPAAVEKEAALTTARAEAARGRAHLLFFDECDLHLLPVIRAMWMKGPRVRVPTPGTNRKRAFFGALDAATGTWFAVDHDRKLAVHFVAFLQRIAAAYPSGPLYLALDNVKMHDAKVVRAWLAANPRVRVLWLPKYAAHDANPVERIWGLMKDNVAANRLAGSIEELTALAHQFFADLAAHPVSLPLAA